jgi:hypothetical protein
MFWGDYIGAKAFDRLDRSKLKLTRIMYSFLFKKEKVRQCLFYKNQMIYVDINFNSFIDEVLVDRNVGAAPDEITIIGNFLFYYAEREYNCIFDIIKMHHIVRRVNITIYRDSFLNNSILIGTKEKGSYVITLYQVSPWLMIERLSYIHEYSLFYMEGDSIYTIEEAQVACLSLNGVYRWKSPIGDLELLRILPQNQNNITLSPG